MKRNHSLGFSFCSRLTRVAGLLAVLVGFSAKATNPSYTWTSTTGGSSITDGAGSWDTSHANWLLNGSGTAVNWGNSPVWDATIGNGGSGGTITVGTVTVGNLTFASVASAYTVSTNISGGGITLSGTPTITVNASQASLNAPLSGAFSVNASATGNKLYLGGNSTSIGTITINGGILDLKGMAGGPVLPNATAIVINSGGTLWNEYNDKPATYNCGYAVTINTGGTFTQKYGGSSAFLGGGTGTPSITLAGGTFDASTGKTPSNIGVNITADSTLGSAVNTASVSFSGSAWTIMNGTRKLTVNAPMTVTAVVGDGGLGYGLTIAGTSTLTLSNATETYSGPTTINSGTLVLGPNGVLNAASGIVIGAGGTFDVSGLTTWTVGSSATPGITASGTGTAATIKGGTTVSFGTRPVTLNWDGSHDTMLTISQGALTLNGNSFTVNGSSTLSPGIHNIIQVTGGSISVSGSPSVNGTAIPAGSTATISTSGGTPNYVTLNIQTTPAISGLSSQSASVGDTVTLASTVTGSPTPALQWQRGGTNMADGATSYGSSISGSTTSTLVISTAQTADSGTYYLIATNAIGKVTNSVLVQVSSGAFAPSVSGLTNQNVLAGTNATLSATVSGSPIPGLQWYFSANGGATSNALPGATGSSLTLTNVQFSQNNYQYILVATNSAGSAVSNMTLTVTQIAPTIAGLTNRTVNARFNAALSATVGGAPSPALQWSVNGSPILGATNSTLTLTNVQLLQSGYVYSLAATNTAGTTTSNLVLTVTNALFNVQLNGYGTSYTGPGQVGVAGDKWNTPTLVGVNGTVYSSNAPATSLASGVSLVDSRGASSPVSFSMTGSNYIYQAGGTSSGHGELTGLNDHFLKFDYVGNSLISIATLSLSGLPPNTSLNLFGYGTYSGYSGGPGSTWTFAAANGGATAFQYYNGNTANGMDLTQSTNQGTSWIQLVGTTDAGGNLTVNVTPAANGHDWWQTFLNGFQIQLHTPPLVSGLTNATVIQGNNVTLAPTITGVPSPTFQWQTNGVSLAGATNASLTLNNVQYSQNGYVYSLISSNQAGIVTNSMILTVTVTPSITGLNNQTATIGDLVTISPAVSGVPAPSIQWRFNGNNLNNGVTGNGSVISGVANSTLYLTNAQSADSGTYSIVASNSAGAVTNDMTLTVSSGSVAPGITGPASQTAIQGSNATFTASVSGLPIPSLQWLQNGTPIANATNSSLTLTNIQYSQNGYTYSLVASNNAGAMTNSATLTVLVPVSISAQPQSVTVTNSQSASFSVVAGGVPSPVYQWYFNGSVIPSATAATYSINSCAPANIGNYSVVVSNSVNVVTSSVAALTVNSTMGYSMLIPASGATTVCYDTPLYLTFSQPPTLRTAGTIRIYSAATNAVPVDTIDLSQCVTLNSSYAANVQRYFIGGQAFTNFPVIISGNTAAIYPHAGSLTSNQTYYVIVDNGTFIDGNGAYFSGITDTNAWRFTTKVGGPVNPTNLVVAADGSGDFVTVQGAVNTVPSGNTTPVTINIRNGTYCEIVNINSRNNLDLRGQSRSGTIIGYANNSWLNGGAPWRASMVVNGNDCTLENLTLTNMTPKGGSQAEAVDVEGTRAIFYNMELDSYQDTFLVHSTGKLVYFQDSLIQGDTDFNWGYGTVYYTNCEVRCLTAGGRVTQPRSPYTTNGFGFFNCRITKGYAGSSTFSLGRSIGTPTTPSEVLFASCLMDDVVTGYDSDAGTNFSDYACSNLTATAAKTLANSAHLAGSDPAAIAIQSASTWLYGWQPALSPNITSQPANQSVSHGQTASFSIAATGIPAPAYQWLCNGTNISGATSATFTIPNAQRANAGTYSVVVSNSSGTVTSSPAILTYNNTAPVAQTMTVMRTAGLSLKIAWTDLATNWSDVDLDPVGLSSLTLLTTNGVTLQTNSTWILYTNGPTAADRINYTVNDAFGGSTGGSINIVMNPFMTGQSTSVMIGGNSATLKFYGIPGYNYVTQRATNIMSPNWVDISTNTVPDAGVFNVNDGFSDIGTIPGAAYYRLKWQP